MYSDVSLQTKRAANDGSDGAASKKKNKKKKNANKPKELLDADKANGPGDNDGGDDEPISPATVWQACRANRQAARVTVTNGR